MSQRIKQTVLLSAGVGVSFLAVKADSARKYLGFFALQGVSTPYPVSTVPLTAANAGLAFATASFLVWEIFRPTHGLLTESEWYSSSGSGLGTGFGVTIEVFEYEDSYLKSPGGVILGSSGGLLDPIQGMGSDRATYLRNMIQSTQRTARDGRS